MGVAGSGERGMPRSENWSVQMRDTEKGKDFRYVFKLKVYRDGEFQEVRADDPTLTDAQRRTIQTHLAASYGIKGVKKDLVTSSRFNMSEVGYHAESLETISNANVKPVYPPKTEFAFGRDNDKVRFQKNIHEVWKVLQNRPGRAEGPREEPVQAHEAHGELPPQPLPDEPEGHPRIDRVEAHPHEHFAMQMDDKVKKPLDMSMGLLQNVIHEAPILVEHPEAAHHLEDLVGAGRKLLENPKDHAPPKKMEASLEALEKDLEKSPPQPKEAVKAPREFKKAQARPATPAKSPALQENMDKFLKGTQNLAKAVNELSEPIESPPEEIPQASIDTTPHKKLDLSKLLDAAKALNQAMLGLNDQLTPQEPVPVAEIQDQSQDSGLKGLLEKAKTFSSDMKEAANAFQNAQETYEDTVETLHAAYSQEEVDELLDFAFLKKAPPEPVLEQAVAVTSVYVQAVKELEMPPPPREEPLLAPLHPATILQDIKKIPHERLLHQDLANRISMPTSSAQHFLKCAQASREQKM